MFAGHQRRAVFQRGPGSGRQRGIRFGQHLPVDGDVLRHGKAGERAVGRERGEMLRLFPGQAAAEAAAAAAQFDRHQIVIGLRQPRAGKAHQHAALLDPGIEAFADFGRQRADIGQHDHRQLLVEELRDRLLRRAAIAEPHVGERRQRAGEIEGRGQQRLRGIAGRAADDADRAPAPSLVEQLHRAGGSFAGYFEPRDVVAQFDRQIERGFGLAVLRRESCNALRRSANPSGRARARRRRRCRYRCAAPSRSSWPRHFRRRPAPAARACRLRKPSACDRRWSCPGLREIPVRARYRRHPTARRSRSRRWLSGNARSRAAFRPARSNRVSA